VTQPQPHMDFSEIRTAAHHLAQKRRDARRDYERYSEQAADAERDYRKRLAKAFAEAKSAGDVTAAQAELHAYAQAADHKHKRDLAQAMAKSCLLRIEELEADRAMLRQLGDWSQRMEGVAA
jgi:uncharacterized coiled-coil DUF342 family protein